MLRPTPGDPWGIKQHHWNTEAKENQQLNPKVAKNGFVLNCVISDKRPFAKHILRWLVNNQTDVYRFYRDRMFTGRADFSDQFRKIIVRYKRIGYNIDIMRQSACLVFNPITVNNFASLFNCTPVGRASDSMMAPT